MDRAYCHFNYLDALLTYYITLPCPKGGKHLTSRVKWTQSINKLLLDSADDLSPPPRFHMSFLVENQAGVTMRILTSDNDPPDGFKLEPEHTSIITKEVSNPSDMSLHAVIPGEEKTLLVNGQPRIIVSPSKATGDPILLRITGRKGAWFVYLFVCVSVLVL